MKVPYKCTKVPYKCTKVPCIWKIPRKAKDMMLDAVLKVMDIIASVINTIMKMIDIAQRAKDKHQKKQPLLDKVVGCFFK